MIKRATLPPFVIECPTGDGDVVDRREILPGAGTVLDRGTGAAWTAACSARTAVCRGQLIRVQRLAGVVSTRRFVPARTVDDARDRADALRFLRPWQPLRYGGR